MAQMTNQDIMNPQDNTQMVAQMAQFSSLQAMNTMMEATTTMSEFQQSSYATSYVGKNVTIADIGKDDKIVEISGTVESVTFYDGKPQVIVNGEKYDLHKVMKVNASADAMTSNNTANALQQATSAYLGKYVILTHVDAKGEPHDVRGYVKSVMLKAGQPHVTLHGGESEDSYPTSAITDVFANDQDAPPDPNAPKQEEINGTSAEIGSRSFEDLDPNKTYNFSSEDYEDLRNGTY
jgi:flagellar basal-body rod modification protein FlgD